MRCSLNKAVAILVLALLVVWLPLAALAQTTSKRVVLHRWVDSQGAVHYTENLEDVPAQYRATAVKGTFIPEIGEAEPTTFSGRLEEIEETYTREGNFYHIRGKVKNGFSQEVQIKVKISFYDEEDRFLFAETTLVDPILLGPAQIGRYHLMVNFNSKIDTYKTEYIGRP